MRFNKILVVDDEHLIRWSLDQNLKKQGYEVVRIASMILHDKKNPADIPCIRPSRGPICVNRERAEMLHIDLTDKAFIEKYIEKALALDKYQQNGK